MNSVAQRAIAVYMVEDSEAIRARLIELLRVHETVRVVGQAETAEAAIAGIRAAAPDVVTLDLHLREGSGLDVLRALKNDARRPIFIVLTNHADEQYRRACFAAGAGHVLDKSREFEHINDIIASCDPAHR